MAREDANAQSTASSEGAARAGGVGFKSVITTTLTVAIVAGLGFGLYRGLSPLEHRAVSIIGARTPTVDVRWPTMGGAKDDAKARAGKDTGLLGTALLSVSSASLDDVPTWLPKQMQEDIKALAEKNLDPGSSPLSVDPLRQVGTAMELSGWFDGRPVVRREPGGRVAVSGNWRIPGAVIREGKREYMISWDGKPMPVTYEAGEANLPAITGVAFKAPAGGAAIDYTKAWPGEDVQAALELLRVIQGKPWAKQVSSIDVKNFESDRTLSLLTTSGGRLNWGGRPNKPRLGEAGTPAKLATIDWIQKRFGTIDRGGHTIDVFWQGRPLEIDVSASAGQAGGEGVRGLPTSPLPPG